MTKQLLFLLIIICTIQSCIKAAKTEKKFAIANDDKTNKIIKIDTIKRNDNIVYDVTKDTVIDGLEILVCNKNIYEKYVHQDFYLTDSVLIRNFYPEMVTTVKVLKNNIATFEKSFFKKDFPAGNFENFKKSATIKDFKFENFDSETKEINFIGTLYIPNTDFENDYRLTVSENGKSKFIKIDYEGED